MTKAVWGSDYKNQRLINLAAGANPGDAVNFQQLQDAIRGLDVKDPVRAATTTNITLSGLQTIDGVALAAGDRVLVKNQTTASANGIYVAGTGAWARSTDADDNVEVTTGFSVAVLEGTTKGTGSSVANPMQYVLSTQGAVTVGTTALAFSPVGGSGGAYSPGTGILISGGTIAIDPAYTGLAKRFSMDLPAASAGTTITITHGLGTKDLLWSIYEVSSGIEQDVDFVSASTTTITGSFPVAITAGQYRIVIIG